MTRAILVAQYVVLYLHRIAHFVYFGIRSPCEMELEFSIAFK